MSEGLTFGDWSKFYIPASTDNRIHLGVNAAGEYVMWSEMFLFDGPDSRGTAWYEHVGDGGVTAT